MAQPTPATSSTTILLPDSLQVALKEWHTVCLALEQGRQILLLRKGGIFESADQFQLEHPQFLFFPTWLHQNLRMLKPAEHAGFESYTQEPSVVHLSAAGAVTDIIRLAGRPQMDVLDDQHVWTAPLIDMRFSYRPSNPLYLLLVRVYSLPRQLDIENTVAYAGCKSWVPLDAPISTAGATPVLDDDAYARRRRSILEKIAAAAK